MGNTCGGVAQACCSHDVGNLNVDISHQIDSKKESLLLTNK